MKKLIVLAFLGFQMVAVSGARANGPDQMYPIVDCHSLNISLSSSVEVQIKEGGFSGVTLAEVTLQQGPAPIHTVGPIAVRQRPVQPGVDGAPLVYEGENFTLSINVDGAPTPQGHYSHFNADLEGQRFNEPMMCQMLARPL